MAQPKEFRSWRALSNDERKAASVKKKCLNCDKTFMSRGSHNRICPQCSRLSIYRETEMGCDLGFVDNLRTKRSGVVY